MSDENRLTPEEREELTRQAAETIREKEIARQAAREAAFTESAKIRQNQIAQAEARVRAEHDAHVAENTNLTLYVLIGVLVLAMALGTFFLFGRSTQPTPSATVEPEQAQPQVTQPQQPAPTVVLPPPPPVVVERESPPPQQPTTIVVKPPPAANQTQGSERDATGSGSGAGPGNSTDQSGQ